MAYLLPLTSDGERTFSVVLGSNTYFFRSYYVRGQESAWLLDISDAGGSMLASGVKLVPGSPNCLAGYGDAFNGENIVVALSRGRPGDEEAPGDTLNVLWFPEGEESPFTLGDPMETLGEAIRLAGEYWPLKRKAPRRTVRSCGASSSRSARSKSGGARARARLCSSRATGRLRACG